MTKFQRDPKHKKSFENFTNNIKRSLKRKNSFFSNKDMERSIEEFEESQTNPKKIKFSFPRFNLTKTHEV